MMEVMNEYGWTVFYFAGFVTGIIISTIVYALDVISTEVNIRLFDRDIKKYKKYLKDKYKKQDEQKKERA